MRQTIATAKIANRVEGKKIDELSPAKRQGFEEHYKVVFGESGTAVIRQRDGQGLNLHLDENGVIQSGLANNANPLRFSKSKMKEALREGIEVKDRQPIHHLQPNESAGKAPMTKGAVELDGYNINKGRSLY